MSSDFTERQPRERITSFSGARGVLAIVVVLWHCYLVAMPSLGDWLSRDAGPVTRWLWMVFGTLDLSSGIASFFIFSGLVLALPVLGGGFDWVRYYPARLLRLYIPAWCALVFAYLLLVAAPRSIHAPSGSWLAASTTQHETLAQLLWTSSLMNPQPTLDSPLWSVTWEVLFSAGLPIFVIIARATTRGWAPTPPPRWTRRWLRDRPQAAFLSHRSRGSSPARSPTRPASPTQSMSPCCTRTATTSKNSHTWPTTCGANASATLSPTP